MGGDLVAACVELDLNQRVLAVGGDGSGGEGVCGADHAGQRRGLLGDPLDHRLALRCAELAGGRCLDRDRAGRAAGGGELLGEQVLRALRLGAGHREAVRRRAAQGRGGQAETGEYDKPERDDEPPPAHRAPAESVEKSSHVFVTFVMSGWSVGGLERPA